MIYSIQYQYNNVTLVFICREFLFRYHDILTIYVYSL